MITCQVNVEFCKAGIREISKVNSRKESNSELSGKATVVKVDSETLFFYFLRDTVSNELFDIYFSDNEFLMTDSLTIPENLRSYLRLPEDSIVPAGIYSCRNMGSRIAVRFSYCQNSVLPIQNLEQSNDTKVNAHLRAA